VPFLPPDMQTKAIVIFNTPLFKELWEKPEWETLFTPEGQPKDVRIPPITRLKCVVKSKGLVYFGDEGFTNYVGRVIDNSFSVRPHSRKTEIIKFLREEGRKGHTSVRLQDLNYHLVAEGYDRIASSVLLHIGFDVFLGFKQELLGVTITDLDLEQDVFVSTIKPNH